MKSFIHARESARPVSFAERERERQLSYRKLTFLALASASLALAICHFARFDQARAIPHQVMASPGTTKNPAAVTSEGSVRPPQPRDTALTALPLRFVENRGQIDSSVKFLARHGGATEFFTSDGFAIRMMNPEKSEKKSPPVLISFTFENHNPNVIVTGSGETLGVENYFFGNDPQKWVTGAQGFGKINYSELYPGVSLDFYERNRQLEYDLCMEAGSDLSKVVIRCDGAQSLALDSRGALIVKTPLGEIHQLPPVATVLRESGESPVTCSYRVIDDTHFGYSVPDWDGESRLVIDPFIIIYSTYLGSTLGDSVNAIDVDGDGYVYVTGYTNSVAFPTTLNAFDTTYNSNWDAFVSKINPLGTRLIYSTYFGSDLDDFGYGIVAERASGICYVTGSTAGGTVTTFPASGNSAIYQGGQSDAFIARMDPAGFPVNTNNGWSFLLGAQGADAGHGITIDNAPNFPNVYVTGYIGSSPQNGNPPISIGFPTPSPLYTDPTPINLGVNPPSAPDLPDPFIARIINYKLLPTSPVNGTVTHFEFHGAQQVDKGYAITYVANNTVYITGETDAGFATFPNTANATQPLFGGWTDAFVAGFQFVTTPTATVNTLFSTYLGGVNPEIGRSIASTPNGDIFVAGVTQSPNFPATAGVVHPLLDDGYLNAGFRDGFVWRALLPNGAPPAVAPAVIYSTFLGSADVDEIYGIVLKGGLDAIVTGLTKDLCFPNTCVYPLASPAPVSAFVTRLNATGTAILDNLVFGGNQTYGQCIAIDLAGDVYVGGRTNSITFPVTTGAVGPALAGSDDGFVTKIR